MRQEALGVLRRPLRISHTGCGPRRCVWQVWSAEHVQAFVKPTQTCAEYGGLLTAEIDTTRVPTRKPGNHTIGVASHFQNMVTSRRRHRNTHRVVQLGQLDHHPQIAARGIDTDITDPLERVHPRNRPYLPILIHQSGGEEVHLEDRTKTETITNSPKIIRRCVSTGGERKIHQLICHHGKLLTDSDRLRATRRPSTDRPSQHLGAGQTIVCRHCSGAHRAPAHGETRRCRRETPDPAIFFLTFIPVAVGLALPLLGVVLFRLDQWPAGVVDVWKRYRFKRNHVAKYLGASIHTTQRGGGHA